MVYKLSASAIANLADGPLCFARSSMVTTQQSPTDLPGPADMAEPRVQQAGTATLSARDGSNKPPSKSDLPQRLRTTWPSGVRIERITYHALHVHQWVSNHECRLHGLPRLGRELDEYSTYKTAERPGECVDHHLPTGR
jgi:hypothetical protein